MQEQFTKLTGEIKDKLVEWLRSKELEQFVEKTKAAEDSGTFEVIISTADIDRQGESIDQNGWDLTFYKLNPVVLWAHDYWSLPIGICDEIAVQDGKLVAKGRFAPEECNAFAQQVRRLYDAKIVRTTSVGFIPLEMDGSNIKRAELLEFSFVPVPANPYALSLRQIKELALDTAMLKMKGLEIKEEETVKVGANEDDATGEGIKAEVIDCTPEAMEKMGFVIIDSEEKFLEWKKQNEPHENCISLLSTNFLKELLDIKAGRVLSDKNRQLIQNCIDEMEGCGTQLENSIAALQELLTATDNSGKSEDQPEGNEPEDPQKKGTAKQRSKDGGSDDQSLDEWLVIRQVLRSAVNGVSSSLEGVNKKIREKSSAK